MFGKIFRSKRASLAVIIIISRLLMLLSNLTIE